MRARAALVLVAAGFGLVITPAAAEVSTKAPRATLVQVLRGGRQALILDRVSGEYGVVKVGDTIHGLRVAEIEPDQIVLATPTPPERYFVLPLVEAAAPGAAAPPAGAAGPPANPITAPVDAPPGPDGAANPAKPANPGGDVAPETRGATPPGPEQPEPGVVVPEDLAGDAPDGGDVLDPYSTVPGAGAGEAEPVDPYGSGGAGDIPSIIAPPASRAEPGPAAPYARPDVRPSPESRPDVPEARPDVRPSPESRPDVPEARPDVRPSPESRPSRPAPPDDIAPDLDAPLPGDLDADSGLDAEAVPPDDIGTDDITDEIDDAPAGSDSKVTTVKPTEVQPRARAGARAPEEPAQTLSRRELDWALSDFAALARQIQIERARQGGVRIVALERGSFLAKLGIKRGDVVKRVAGHPIDTVDQAAAAYAALADSRDVMVELERRGAPLRLRYRLTK